MRVQIRVEEEKCVGCRDCLFVCPVQVFEMRKGKAFPVDSRSCCGKTCMLCVHYCWKEAITQTQT